MLTSPKEYRRTITDQVGSEHWFRRLSIEPVLFILIIVLLVLSSFIVYSAVGEDITVFYNHLRNIFIGLCVLVLLSRFPTRYFFKISGGLYLVSILLLLVVELFGVTINGSKRWLSFYFLNFQPTELAKFSISIFVCNFIARQDWPLTFVPLVKVSLILFIPVILIAKQPDLGSSILVTTGSVVAIFLAGISWRYIATFFILIMAFLPAAWLWLLKGYQKQRIMTLINPEADVFGSGWNIVQSKTAIGSGGISGKGWMQGTQSHLEFLPEGHTDFIISVYSEEFGFLGLALIVVLYSAIFFRCMWICKVATTTVNQLLAAVFSMIFFFSFFVNTGMVSGLLPVVGIPLPLMSYGGTSIVTFLFSFGILMSIWRESRPHI